MRVLLVEDNAILAMTLTKTLQETGFQVLGPASTASEAIEMVASDLPDRAILDVHLRGGDSMEVAMRLHELGIPFFFLTGYGHLPHLPPKLAKVRCLRKPVSLSTLLSALEADV